MIEQGRIIVWFSRGAASAVAAKIAVQTYSATRTVEVIYLDTSADEHPDSERFEHEVEAWIGQKILRLSHPKYRTVEQCWRGEKFMVGAFGAACTRAMKRELQRKYVRPDDRCVIGFTADERGRARLLQERFPEENFLWLLIPAGITKEDCYHILSAQKIELPAMYRLGYEHNNCIGCIKGGKGYWNKIRRDFPEVFARRAAVQREMGVGFNSGGELFFLDELDPEAGRDVPEPQIECGLFCDQYSKLIQVTSQLAGAAR